MTKGNFDVMSCVFDRGKRSGSGPKNGKVVVVVVLGDLGHFPKIYKN